REWMKKSMARRRRLQQLMFGEFASQGIAIDAEHLRGGSLIAIGVAENELQHRSFDIGDHHFVDRGRFFAVEVAKILFERAMYALGHFIRSTHAASSCTVSSS